MSGYERLLNDLRESNLNEHPNKITSPWNLTVKDGMAFALLNDGSFVMLDPGQWHTKDIQDKAVAEGRYWPSENVISSYGFENSRQLDKVVAGIEEKMGRKDDGSWWYEIMPQSIGEAEGMDQLVKMGEGQKTMSPDLSPRDQMYVFHRGLADEIIDQRIQHAVQDVKGKETPMGLVSQGDQENIPLVPGKNTPKGKEKMGPKGGPDFVKRAMLGRDSVEHLADELLGEVKRVHCSSCGRVVEHPHYGEEPEHCDRCIEDHENEEESKNEAIEKAGQPCGHFKGNQSPEKPTNTTCYNCGWPRNEHKAEIKNYGEGVVSDVDYLLAESMGDESRPEPGEWEREALAHNFPESSEFDREAALYWYANDYHEGQDSDLYSVLSTSQFKPSPLHYGVDDEGETAREMYDFLVRQNEVPR